MKKNKDKPFEERAFYCGASVGILADWLKDNAIELHTSIADKYTVRDLIEDLDNIADAIWNDGIDAMGEDA